MERLNLNGVWRFSFRENANWNDAAEPIPDNIMCVPGTFDTMPAWNSRRGVGYYRTEFTLERDCAGVFLHVDGMGLRGRFAVDGREIGRSELAYSALDFATCSPPPSTTTFPPNRTASFSPTTTSTRSAASTATCR